MDITLTEDLLIEDIGFKHTFTGECFMIELNTLRIKKGFTWDGTSVVKNSKFSDTRCISWVATCIHNCLYNKKNPLTRLDADYLFYRELKNSGYSGAMFYFIFLRMFGWMFYKGKM